MSKDRAKHTHPYHSPLGCFEENQCVSVHVTGSIGEMVYIYFKERTGMLTI